MLTYDKQASIYSILYNKIPANHTLRLINDHVDFRFINLLLEDSYSKYYGRPAKEPELMIKLLVLQHLYDLSDVRVIEEASLNLAYLYFLGMNPEEELPDASLLSKFRKHRLEDCTMDDILTEINRQCVEKGIIKGESVTIDSTHTHAHTVQKTPEKVMRRLAKRLNESLVEETGGLPPEVDPNLPDIKDIKDHKLAKATMKAYVEKNIDQMETQLDTDQIPKTKQIIDNAKVILEDPKFLESKGVKSIVDQDARVGHKSKTEIFFGYKTEFMMTVPEYLITAVHVDHGAYVDGSRFKELLERTRRSGITIRELLGDKAYFQKRILDTIRDIGATPYIPVSEMVYRVNDERFHYNKDSDEWFCGQGNKTVKKVEKTSKKGYRSLKYYFDTETCRACPLQFECAGKDRVTKILEVGVNTPEFYSYKEFQQSDHFKETYRKRASQEWKNGEMKNFHGLDCARGYSLLSVSRQAKLTALAVNLKRIAKLLSSSTSEFSISVSYLMVFPLRKLKIYKVLLKNTLLFQ